MKQAQALSLPRIRRICLALCIPLMAWSFFAFGSPYLWTQLEFVAVWGLATLGLNLIVGQAGQLYLGFSAFIALGAYAEAIAIRNGIPSGLALFLCALLSGLAGALAALPARRLSGMPMALSGLALALLVEEGLLRWNAVTGGAQGLRVPTLLPSPYGPIFAWILLMTALWSCSRLMRSRWGRAWHALQQDETATDAIGIPPFALKCRIFTLGATLGGVAGALYAHALSYISPEQFNLEVSFELLVAVYLGGKNRLLGALWGALFLVGLPEILALGIDTPLPGWEGATGLKLLLFGLFIVLWVSTRASQSEVRP